MKAKLLFLLTVIFCITTIFFSARILSDTNTQSISDQLVDIVGFSISLIVVVALIIASILVGSK